MGYHLQNKMSATLGRTVPATLTNVDFTLFDEDHRTVNLVGDVSDWLAGTGVSHGTRKNERVTRGSKGTQRDSHVETVREHLIAGDNVSVEKHFECAGGSVF